MSNSVSRALARTGVLLAQTVVDLPVGANVSIVTVLLLLLSGRLLRSRGAVFLLPQGQLRKKGIRDGPPAEGNPCPQKAEEHGTCRKLK
jgi:hypothetical protein